MTKFKEKDEIFYIAGARSHDQLVIASVQSGMIEDVFFGTYLIEGVLYPETRVFSDHHEAVKALMVIMTMKIECLKDKIKEFSDYQTGIVSSRGSI